MTDSAPTVSFADMRARLEASGRAARELHEAWETELERRDQLVVDALDQGMPQTAVAAAVGLSQQRVGRLTLPRAARRPA